MQILDKKALCTLISSINAFFARIGRTACLPDHLYATDSRSGVSIRQILAKDRENIAYPLYLGVALGVSDR